MSINRSMKQTGKNIKKIPGICVTRLVGGILLKISNFVESILSIF